MSLKKQMSFKSQLKSSEQAIGIIANRLDELSESLFKEAVRAESVLKLLQDKGIFTKEEYETKLQETFDEAIKAMTEANSAEANSDNIKVNVVEETAETNEDSKTE